VKRLGAAVLGVVVFSGCAYYNTLYNSQRLYDEAEGFHRIGLDSLAEARYQDVIRKTADAYRGRPTGEDAAHTLFLLGRAQLRVGQPREARAALAQAARLTREPGLRPQILVHLAVASSRIGEETAALGLLDEAFTGELAGQALGEAYLLRGHLRLRQASTAKGWDDLDRAAATDPGVAVEAGVARLRWGVHHRDLQRSRSALARLLVHDAAGERVDTIGDLVLAAAAGWSPSVAATLLGDVEEASWDRAARSRLGLQQARLMYLAGDTAVAEELAWRVARGRGESVARARLLLAHWVLDRTRDLGDAQSVLPILLPAGDEPEVAELVDAVEALDRFSGIGLDEPLGWFAAAEVARDRLEAPILARGLFLAYVDTDPGDPWAPKALLAALDVSADAEDQAWLRGRLEAHRNSPYVQAARGGSATGFEALEEELRVRLSEIATR
jgi:tetratricopeptide (TPR) repeat protein